MKSQSSSFQDSISDAPSCSASENFFLHNPHLASEAPKAPLPTHRLIQLLVNTSSTYPLKVLPEEGEQKFFVVQRFFISTHQEAMRERSTMLISFPI